MIKLEGSLLVSTSLLTRTSTPSGYPILKYYSETLDPSEEKGKAIGTNSKETICNGPPAVGDLDYF